MWRIIGWVLVFLFPLYMVYLTGGPDKGPEENTKRQVEKSVETPTKKNKKKKSKATEDKVEKSVVEPKKKNKKKNAPANAAATAVEKPKVAEQLKVAEQPKAEPVVKKQATKKQQKKKEQVKQTEPKMEHVKQVEPKQEKEALIKKEEEKPVAKEEIVTPTKEIDEHMDPTANYARVLRIRPEEIEDEWESVPYEEGWSQVKTRRPAGASSGSSSKIDVNAEINMTTAVLNSHLDKKQRENLARTQKKKEAKLAADKLQEERLKKHKKELEKAKIQEFYSSGKGKNTPWGKNGQRSKTPQSVASINEFGQLIWD